MATSRAKESSGLGKERKITAPTSLTIPNSSTKRTPKSSPRGQQTDHKLAYSSSFSSSSSSSSSSSTHSKLTSSSSSPSLSMLSEKHIPNYLKSTASSRHDHGSFKPVKKSAGPAPIPEGKSSLNRRRSFDKPPPTTPRLDKPFRSPGPRCRATHVPVRSSSFGAKPATTIVSSTKPGLLERSASKGSSKVGGKPQQSVHNFRSGSNAKKSLRRESSNASSASAEMVPKTKNAVEHVDHQCPSFVLGVNEEELKKIECELDPFLPDPMPELDKELRTYQVEKKVDVLDKKEADAKHEAEKKLHHHQQPILDTEISKAETETPPAIEAEAKPLIQKEQNQEQNERVGEEEAKDEEKPEIITEEKEVDKDEEKSEIIPIQEGGEGVVALDQEEAQDGQNFKEENNTMTTKVETGEKEAEVTEKVEVAAAAAEKEAEAVAEKVAAMAAKRQGSGRKESPAMYNDVIEETASKLLEKRKNKVRALAGAFQTVIDYESSSK